MATEEDVRRAALALPGVVERPSWGQPAWFAATLMARMWEEGCSRSRPRNAKRSPERTRRLISGRPIMSVHRCLVLVRLDRIDLTELGELLEESHRIAGGGRR
ncbi:MmcQ/YjbR family DNA-binding protein [Arthrobacter sp. OVS8]|nr:MmcQ/YjbR family DNA-binding protein [Arthrobacter sp. OVS8]